jgi:membrane-associated phospholipid phosphatase
MPTYSIREHAKNKSSDKSKTGLLICFFIALILFCLTAYIAHKHQLTGLQARLFYDVDNLNLPSGFTTAARWITEGLGAGYPIAVCVLVPLFFKNYRLAWRFLVTVVGAVAVGLVIKYVVKEPRPITMLAGHLRQRVVETGPGFPSGHEEVATALALTLWFILPPRWRWLSILWMVVLAFSRLYLGVHTPADIIGGFSIGLLAVCVVRLLPDSIAKPLRLDEIEHKA